MLTHKRLPTLLIFLPIILLYSTSSKTMLPRFMFGLGDNKNSNNDSYHYPQEGPYEEDLITTKSDLASPDSLTSTQTTPLAKIGRSCFQWICKCYCCKKNDSREES